MGNTEIIPIPIRDIIKARVSIKINNLDKGKVKDSRSSQAIKVRWPSN